MQVLGVGVERFDSLSVPAHNMRQRVCGSLWYILWCERALREKPLKHLLQLLKPLCKRCMPAVTPETVLSQLKLEAKVQTFFGKFADFDEADQQDSLELLRRLHIRYVQGGLGYLPSGYSSLDSGRPWICYWILHSLALLDGPLPASVSASDVIAFLNLCQADNGGYGGSPGQLPHLAPSYAAVAALVSVGQPTALSSIQRDSMNIFLHSRCISPAHGGGFAVCEGTQQTQASPAGHHSISCSAGMPDL